MIFNLLYFGPHIGHGDVTSRYIQASLYSYSRNSKMAVEDIFRTVELFDIDVFS